MKKGCGSWAMLVKAMTDFVKTTMELVVATVVVLSKELALMLLPPALFDG